MGQASTSSSSGSSGIEGSCCLRGGVGFFGVVYVSFRSASKDFGAGVRGDERLHLGHVGRARRSVVLASTLRRSNGSVFDGRTLNHQSACSTVSPSSRSTRCAGGSLGVGDGLHGGRRVGHLGVDLARVGVALERREHGGERLAALAEQLEHEERGDDARVGPEVVAVVVVARVLAAEDGAGLGHHLLDEGVAHPGADRRAPHLGDRPRAPTCEQMRL